MKSYKISACFVPTSVDKVLRFSGFVNLEGEQEADRLIGCIRAIAQCSDPLPDLDLSVVPAVPQMGDCFFDDPKELMIQCGIQLGLVKKD